MSRCCIFVFAVASLAVASSASAAGVPTIPKEAVPVVKCIARILKSSPAVESVSLYSTKEFRFAVEYAFRNKDHQPVVYDIVLYTEGSSVEESNWIPNGISQQTADEAHALEAKLDLTSKCLLRDRTLDDLLPMLSARAEWERIDWPDE